MATEPNQEKDLFNEALELPESERSAYLKGACRGDSALLARVEQLLMAAKQSEAVLRSTTAKEGTVAEASLMEEVGSVIGRYKLLQKIGEGGCGVVYMAEQTDPVRRRVALKVIKLGMDTKSVIARFEAERQALALMDHPNIAKVLDAGATGPHPASGHSLPPAVTARQRGKSDWRGAGGEGLPAGRPYFVMELVRGVKITEYCDQNNLPTRQRLDLFIQICRAVQHAHQKGIIHRDIKPSNILVTLHDGVPVPKVIDFGIAKATTDQPLTDKTLFTQFQQFIGTPAYMSPEQAEMSGLDIDTRTDIYSLGVLLYELLTGKTPFDAQDLLEAGLDGMRRTIREREPVRPSTRLSTMVEGELSIAAKHRGAEGVKLIHLLRGDLDWVVMKALEKDRTRRYETANGLAMDIQRHLSQEPVVARPPSSLYRFQKLIRRNKLAFAAAAAVAGALVLGMVVGVWQAVRATRAREAALLAQKNEEKQRHTAETAQNLATASAERAARNALESRERLVRLTVGNGARLEKEGDFTGALLWFAKALTLVQGDPEQEKVGRLRYASVLQQCPKLVHVCESGEPFNYAVFSPDGHSILTTDDGGKGCLWDASTGKRLAALQHPPNPYETGNRIWYGTFSPDGARVITCGMDHSARIWNAYTGDLVAPPLLHSKWVVYAEFSPDGRYVVTAGLDNKAQIWDSGTGAPVCPPLVHKAAVFQASFSPDGKRVLTASADQTAQLWDASTGRACSPPLQHESFISSALFSRDGRYIVTASSDKTARIWDASTGKPLGSPLQHDSGLSHACFSPDGRYVLTSADEQARLWEVSTGKAVRDFPHTTPVTAFPEFPVFSSDGRLVVVQKSNQIAQVFEALTGLPRTAPLPHNDQVAFAAFSPDSHYVITASRDSTMRVWEVNGPPFAPSGPPRRWVNRVPLSPDRSRFVMACAGGTAQLFETAAGKPIGPPLRHSNSVLCAAFSPDGRLVATGSQDGTARVWDTKNGLPVTPSLPLETQSSYNDRVICLCFSADGKRLAVASLNIVQVWNVATGQSLTQPIQQSGIVESVAFNAEGRQLVTACADGSARVWNSETGQAVTPPLKHEHAVSHAGFSPDGGLVVTASFDQTARVWDAKTGEPITVPLRHGNGVRLAALDSAGGLLTVTEDGAWSRGLAADPRPLEDLALEATVLAGQQIDASGSLVPLTAKEIRDGWSRLSSASQTNRSAESQSDPREVTADEPMLTRLSPAFTLRSAQPGGSQQPIDLSTFYNWGLAEDFFGLKGNNLSALPRGRQKVRGTEFEIGQGVIQLSGQNMATYGGHFPTNVSSIKVGRKCQILHFLHAGHALARDQHAASYVIHFSNGQTWEIPLLGQDIITIALNDKDPASASRSVVAWTVPTTSGILVRLYQTSWENPLPQLEVDSIDFVSMMSWGSAYLVAITVE